MQKFIAGKDAQLYDKSDWAVDKIPVYLNPEGLPETTTVEQAEQMIKAACFSWSLRYSHDLIYSGLIDTVFQRDSIIVNYGSSERLRKWFGSEVNGLCFYHTLGEKINGKRRLVCAEIYINSANRPLANHFTRATIKHELGHACGIHGHNDQIGSVMYRSSMGNEKLTLHDCQMLDNWNPYPVELHSDLSMSVPAVQMPDGRVLWVDLPYSGTRLIHAWSVGAEIRWDGPRLDNVQLGDTTLFHGQPCQYIHMQHIESPDLRVRADLLLAPNGSLILEYAE